MPNYCTEQVERGKKKSKEAAANKMGLEFVAFALNHWSGIGDDAKETILTGYRGKLDSCKNDAERWVVVSELNGALAFISVAVAKRNYSMMMNSASPIGGGAYPTAHFNEDANQENDLNQDDTSRGCDLY